MKGQTHISRRTVLHGAGTAIALPLLEAMIPRTARGAAIDQSPVRMAFVYVPNGMHMPDWTPEKDGPLGELPPILQPLAEHKSNLLLLSGLTLNGARSLGDGGGDHARSVAAFLTGAHPRKTDGKNIQNGISVDQVAAQKIGKRTRFPSLELGCEPSSQGGRCDSGYSCIYTSNMSWRSGTQPVSKEINPRSVFDRLFGTGGDAARQQQQLKSRNENRRSVLDFVLDDAKSLERRLGAGDKQKLDEYLHAVREVERRVKESEKLGEREVDVPDFPRPDGVPADKDEHIRMMFDMMMLALMTDSTRVATFMITNAGSNRSYRHIDVPQGHHSLSHHGRNKEKQRKISRINRHHVQQLKYFLDKMAAVREGERSLLDNSMILYGSGIGDGDRHNHDDLPILLAGSGRGALQTGRHVRYADETPLTNLYLSMLDVMGASTNELGDSTGKLRRLDG